MRTSVLVVLVSLLYCLGLVFGGMAWAQSEKEKTPEDVAWGEVNSLDKQSNEDFLKKFPGGKHTDEAKLGTAIQERLALIRTKKANSACTISFKALGRRWESWQRDYPRKGVIGYFVKKGEKFNSLGMFSPLTGGKTPGAGSFSFDASGVMVSPTGDGSIIAFETDGLKYEFLNGIVIETPGDQPVFFGVLEGTSLVHLVGAGKVTLPEGKACNLK